MQLSVSPQAVAMELHLPLTELELAFGQPLSDAPEAALAKYRPQLEAYLARHIRPVTLQQEPWTVRVTRIGTQSAEQFQSGAFQEAAVTLELTPPPTASTRQFVLHYDAILHQVVTHKALASVVSDWEGGITSQNARPLGTIQVDTGTTKIAPLSVRLGNASRWEGAKGMLSLGMHHIQAGADHLMFLMVLLLPATLLANGRQWGEFGGYRHSIVSLLRTVSAFTLGHSLTLLAGALGWVRFPQQPVEVLIAVSILVSAAHSIRPLFPGREYAVAAGFGLVHGLAFAAGIADLHLGPGELAISILAFNVGIEVMQIFVIALVLPWLLLISPTPLYRWTRIGGATLAAIAAIGWTISRVSGQANPITTTLDNAAGYAPQGIFALALLALLGNLGNPFQRTSFSAVSER